MLRLRDKWRNGESALGKIIGARLKNACFAYFCGGL